MKGLYIVYILVCVDGSYYVGSTKQLEERLQRHNSGDAAEWTKNRRPVKIVYQEEHKTLLSARQREKQLKGWSKVKKEKLINGEWKKL
jgi:putative endonuclease